MLKKPSSQQPLNDWIEWLLQLHPTEIDLGLERVREVGRAMGLLRPAPTVVTVAGTNGKGSSVAMLTSICTEAGYKVGSYTSPHLIRFNERIQINRQPVEDALIIQAFSEIEAVREQLGIKLTYFEFSTLAALWVFARQQVEVAVLEVGLGGRLDAVNIVDADAALITAIDVDHQDWLGSDRNQIALEKAGVLRPGQCAVCSDPQPPQTLKEYAAQLDTRVLYLGEDFDYSLLECERKDGENIGNVQNSQSCRQKWDFESQNPSIDSLEALPAPGLLGAFQYQNACGVVALMGCLSKKGRLNIKQAEIVRGLERVEHPGRLQRLTVEDKHWLLDVAHNPQSAQALAEHLQKQNVTVSDAVFSVLADKESLPMVKALSSSIRRWHIAPLDQPRAMNLPALESLLADAGIERERVQAYASVEEATKAVQASLSDSSKEVALAFGSFFTVGAVLDTLQSDDEDLG